MARRLLLALLIAAASVLPIAPAFPQQADSTAPPEPALLPGVIAVRIANEEICPIVVRIKQYGGETRVGLIAPGRVSWMHLRPGLVGVLEVEIVASPRGCALRIPTDGTTTLPPPSPLGSRASLRELTHSWRRRSVIGAFPRRV